MAPKPFELGSCTDHPELGWCQSDDTQLSAREGRAELLRGAALDVLGQHCAECHTALGTQPAVEPLAIDDPAALVASGLVIPLNGAASPLLQLARAGLMPPEGRPPLTSHELDLLTLWIDTPSFWPEATAACAAPASASDFAGTLESVAVDLALWPASEQRFQRYLSLAHRASAECRPAELELERRALTKALNMLSLDLRVHAPVAVDEARTLYRIDLRSYDWSRELALGGRTFADVWEAIAASSPYSVELTGSAAVAVRSAAGTAFPLLLADHVLDAALTGELYYAILGVDGSRDLLSDFLIDEAQNLEDGEVVRAGTTRSRLSVEDRLVQRQELGNRRGVFWQALEVPARGSSMFDHPLGPMQGAGQGMFSLRNGFFAFVTMGADATPSLREEVRIDALGYALPSEAAVTCSACHGAGLLPVVDEVGPFAVDDARQGGRYLPDEIEAVYPEPDAFARELQADNDEFYRKAMSQLGLPTTGRDPVAAASLRFGAPLTLRDAAAELGVSEEVLRSRLPELPWLAPLVTGSLRRDDFAPLYLPSRCVLSEGSAAQLDPAGCERALSGLR